MNFSITKHTVRLLCVILCTALVVSTIMRLGGTAAYEDAMRTISGSETVAACSREVERRMYEKYGTAGCLAAEQYGTYAELVFDIFWETEEFQKVIKEHGSAKVIPVLLKATTDSDTFKLIEVEYQMRNALAAALASVASGFRAGKDAFNLGEKANEVFLAGIRELIAKSSQIHKAARPLEPQEFAFLLLYGMVSEGGSFLDQFHVSAVDKVETIYSEHAVHLMASLFTSGIRIAETKYRFDRENFEWVRDGGNAALDAALLATPFMGRWVLKEATGTKTVRVTKAIKTGGTVAKATKIAKVTGLALGVTAVGYGITHPVRSLLAVNTAGAKVAEWLNIPFASLLGPFFAWAILLSILAYLFWPIVIPLYIYLSRK